MVSKMSSLFQPSETSISVIKTNLIRMDDWFIFLMNETDKKTYRKIDDFNNSKLSFLISFDCFDVNILMDN